MYYLTSNHDSKDYTIPIYLDHMGYGITVIETSQIDEGVIIIEKSFYTNCISYKNIIKYLKQIEIKYDSHSLRSNLFTYLINEDSNYKKLSFEHSLKTVTLNVYHAITDMKALANDGSINFKIENDGVRNLYDLIVAYDPDKDSKLNSNIERIEIEEYHRIYSLFVFMNHLDKIIQNQNYWDWVRAGSPIPGHLLLRF